MDIISEIRSIAGENNLFTERAECLSYSRDMSVHQGIPDAVVFPRTTQQVSSIMRLAHREKMPVTARGTGTSVTGSVLPVRGGLILDLHLMNRIIEINKKDFYARLETGVICNDLNQILSKDNLMFPPNPGSEVVATIGGMVSTNASGHRAIKYGTTKDYIKGLKVVLADGEVIDTGGITPKSSMGYDLTRLFSAAEGTLGILTEVTVKIEPRPEYSALAICIFGDINGAVEAVTEISTSGIRLAACEIMDNFSLKVVEKALGRNTDNIEALLIIEADGAKEVVTRDITRIENICRLHRGMEFEWTDTPGRRDAMMKARGGLVPTLSRIKPGYRLISICEDLGVASTRIPETIRHAQAISKKYDLIIASFGHVGDGNVHTTFVTDIRSRDEWDRVRAASKELALKVLETGGTLTAEHGTGLARAPHIRNEIGGGLDVMRKIKKALDPDNILNPGKMDLEDTGIHPDILDFFAFEKLLKNPDGLNFFGRETDDEIISCIHCGYCRRGCPTFSVTHRESRNARGRNALAFYLMTGAEGPTEDISDSFYSCTLCQACTYFCPAMIKVDEVVEGARKKLFNSGHTPSKVMKLRENILSTENIYGKPREKRIEIYPPAMKERAERGGLKTNAETLLFMGCVSSFSNMETIPSLLRLMNAAGVDYTMLGENEGCCGLPLFSMGANDFKSHAEKMIKRIKEAGAREIVTPCAGCYKAFKKLYPRIGDLGLEVYHSVHYIDRLLKEGRLRLKGNISSKVTYHDPCDLGRAFKIFDEPRNILQAIPDIKFEEMQKNRLTARCCGGGGLVMTNDKNLARTMAAERVRDALNVGAEIIVTACSTCQDTLAKGIKEIPEDERGTIRVMDITEIAARAMEE